MFSFQLSPSPGYRTTWALKTIGLFTSRSDVRIFFELKYLPYLVDSCPLTVCFVAIIPLERLFDWGGEQMAFYLGKDLGDLLMITMNK